MTMIQHRLRMPAFSIGDRLRKARQTMDGAPDVRAFADMLGISHGTVTRYELEQTPPERMRPIVLHAWADVTGVDEHWLKTGEAPSDDADGASDVLRARRDSNPQPSDPEPRASAGPDVEDTLPSLAAPMILLAGLVTAAYVQAGAR